MGMAAMLFKNAVAAATDYDTLILAETSLAHYYKFDEAAGAATALDSKGSKNGTNSNITAGSTALLSDGKTSYTYNGSNSAVSCAAWSPASAFSLEIWFFMTANPSGDFALFNNGSPLGNGYEFYIDFHGAGNCTLGLTMNGSGYSPTFPNVFGTNQLVHAVMTYDGTNARMYKNGVQQGTAGAMTAPGTPTGTGKIGAAGAGETFTGRIEKPAIYNAALSSVAIAAHYAAR